MAFTETSPITELVTALKNQILANGTPVEVYARGERPEKITSDDFILIGENGGGSVITQDLSYFRGEVIIALYCKVQASGVKKTQRITKLITQVVNKTQSLTTTHFFFSLLHNTPLTPTTVNRNSGYALTLLHLNWRTL